MTTDALISERDLTAYVVGDGKRPGLALIFGWKCHHVLDTNPPAKVVGKGFPDWAFARPPRFLVVELKSQKGRLTADQKMWGEILTACPGIEYYCWRPSDRDEILEVLK